jgi:hypothetical protein
MKFINLIVLNLTFVYLINSTEVKFYGSKFKDKDNVCNHYNMGITKDDINKILYHHNNYRNQIALRTNVLGPKMPYATNMLQMYWDDELAKKAQEHADKCKFQHSDKSFRKIKKFEYVGENLFTTLESEKFPTIDWGKAIDAWFNEYKDFKIKNVITNYNFDSKTAHFSQVVWANTYKIGCGVSHYLSKNGWYTSLYVCQYGPGGNIWKKTIYKPSNVKKCSCPIGTDCKNQIFKGLCCPEKACGIANYLDGDIKID